MEWFAFVAAGYRKRGWVIGKVLEGPRWSEMIRNENAPDAAIANWSPQQRAEAARNLMAYIRILREWDDEERLGRVRRMLESASPEE